MKKKFLSVMSMLMIITMIACNDNAVSSKNAISKINETPIQNIDGSAEKNDVTNNDLEITVTPELTQEPTATPEPSKEPTVTPEPSKEPTATPEPSKEPTATPEPSKEPTATPEATKELTPTPTVTPKPTQILTPTPTVTPEPTKKPKYTYEDKQIVMYAKDGVNVRDLPSTDGNKIGRLSKGDMISVSGVCRETNWYRIEFHGGDAYVSNKYLVDEKPVESTPTPTVTPTKELTPTVAPKPTQIPTSTPTPVPNISVTETASGFKAVWLSQFDMCDVYASSGTQRDKSDFRNRVKEIMKNIKSRGLNTVILQIRPYADSMYPSEYYPMSRYVVGTYGKSASYDPVKIMVDEAHNVGLEIHAWINPMRAMNKNELTLIDDTYKIKQWYNDEELNGKYIVLWKDRYYLNPSYAEVRKLIVDGAKEAMTLYHFDGLHMDDYFYPTTEKGFDESSYAEYKSNGGIKSLENFRRENINKLVKELYNATKSVGKGQVFGISPAGIIETVYGEHYADVYTWCSTKGYVDYICPQVYFGLEHQTYGFEKVCNIWQDIIKTDSIKLIVGMTLEKAFSETDQYAGTGKYEWRNNKDVIKRCLEYTKTLKKCKGVSFFSYQHFFQPLTGNLTEKTREEVANFVPFLAKTSWK